MKAIFHIGLPKTGTTTLQNSLHAARANLARHGILYPSFERLGHLNHHPLILEVLPPEKLPRQFRFKARLRLDRLATGAAARVSLEIAEASPGWLLLSSEYFSREFTPRELARLKALIEGFGVSDLVFSVYVRRPSAHYMSLLTQSLRHSATLRLPEPFHIRRRIDALRAGFPDARIVLAVSDREVLAKGDIVADFVARFLVPLGVAAPEVPTLSEVNVSVSGESTSILMAFRRDAFPGRDNRPEPASIALFETLAEIETRIGPRRPRLRTEVAAYLDAADNDVAWLGEEYGLSFPGLEGAEVRETAPPVIGALSDVIEIDAGYREHILGELERSAWAWRPWRQRWVRALSSGKAPGRLLSARAVLGL